MNKTRLILIGTAAAVITAGGVIIGLTLNNSAKKANISSIHTQAVTETMTESAKPTQPSTTEAPSTAQEAMPEGAGTATSVTAALETYTAGNISIQYPVVSKMEDQKKQDKVNELLKSNALSVITGYGLDEGKDTLTVKCQVSSIDRKRITAAYTGDLSVAGGAHPVSLFYSNTVDLSQALDLGFQDFTDAYTMAGYVLSDDVVFLGLTGQETEEVLEFRKTLSLEELTAIFENADFPLKSKDAWPESFSYEKQGVICFSMPVPHALGDYVIVTFDPTTK